MPVFVTQLEGDTLIPLEAETSGAFAKSELEIKASPMAAFDNSVAAMGNLGRVMAGRIQEQFAGTGIESAQVTFGIKVDHAGMVMIAQEKDRAQFNVTLNVRVT